MDFGAIVDALSVAVLAFRQHDLVYSNAAARSSTSAEDPKP
jgi:hypothetical protein